MRGVPRRRATGAVAVLATALALTGCGLGGVIGTGSDDTDPSAGTDGTRAPLAATETVTVGKRSVATRCAGDRRNPSVLLVADLGTDLGDSWDTVQPVLGDFAHVCAYDRLGVGGSDPPPDRQTFADLADDLDAVVDALRLTRPVVLVAHGLGGVVAVTWAAEHGEDLAGLVLVDATPPTYVATALGVLPAEAGARGSALRAELAALLGPGGNPERLAGRAVLQGGTVLAPLGGVPLVALTRSVSDYDDVRRRDAARLDSAWLGGQQRWAGLSTGGRVQIVDLAGHAIQDDQPQVVVDVVREVVTATQP